MSEEENLPQAEDVYELLFVKPELDRSRIDIRCNFKKLMEEKVTGEDEGKFKSDCDAIRHDALVQFEKRCGDHCQSKHYADAKSELKNELNEDVKGLKYRNDRKRFNKMRLIAAIRLSSSLSDLTTCSLS
ncbi:hypothetical protein M3Y98_01198800 [Aphelenchoides besseyi]|nr:hypothetical protein M3Y98_01198800 [Aphelenchoides besseyi]KAI6193135.1 hypothetical protein M3Y96_00986100 [Aphelenchoides besseyi]